MRKSVESRFHEKYVSVPFSGCWIWTAATSGKGYGKMMITDGQKEPHLESAHHISWRLHRGGVPSGLHVLHRCDVRCCVNPDHLFVGTNLDNVRDRMAKGRPGGRKPIRE